jgi:hypothetical protein
MNSRELRSRIDIKRPKYQGSKRELLDLLAKKGGKKGEFLLFGPYYEIFMYAFFIGYHRKERLPLSDGSEKVDFLEIGKWKPIEIVDYILLLLINNKEIIKTEWIKIENFNEEEIDEFVKNIITAIDEYANAGLSYINDKVENDKNEFTDPFVFVNILNEIVDKSKEKTTYCKTSSINKKIGVQQSELFRIKGIIEGGENSNVEFKTSLRFCVHQKKADKKIEHASMKTIAAFLNSDGGTLLIGVDDNKNILGLFDDFTTLKQSINNRDEFQKHFDNLVENYLGNSAFSFINLLFHNFDGNTICEIQVKPNTKKQTMLRNMSENGKEEFYMRRSASTKSLSPTEMLEYIENHWGGTTLK